MLDYNTVHKHPRDEYIHFTESTHTYRVELPGVAPVECESVTQVVEKCFRQFDADYWANRKASTPEQAAELKAQWAAKGEAARRLGTELHERIEGHYLGQEPSAEALKDGGFAHFLRFAGDYELKPYRSEWRIYSERYRLAGTLDFLAFDGTDFRIYDWKRSTKVVDPQGQPIRDNAYGQTAFEPLSHLSDTAYMHYALQLSLYRYILATEYGIDVSSCHLGVFHPALTDYSVVEVPYLIDEVKILLSSRL